MCELTLSEVGVFLQDAHNTKISVFLQVGLAAGHFAEKADQFLAVLRLIFCDLPRYRNAVSRSAGAIEIFAAMFFVRT